MFVSGRKFNGMVACTADVMRQDGIMGFMKVRVAERGWEGGAGAGAGTVHHVLPVHSDMAKRGAMMGIRAACLGVSPPAAAPSGPTACTTIRHTSMLQTLASTRAPCAAQPCPVPLNPAVPPPSFTPQGWSASYARLGPHTVIMFMCAERLRSYAGLTSL